MGKIRIDVNEAPMIWEHPRNECFNKECHFFYDETNNYRKFWLQEEDFNASITSDFVLGGVLYFGKSTNSDVNELKKRVKLQKSAEELKFKHLIEKGSSFLDCLANKKIRIFLEWLNDSDLYIHYSNINNFYYALVDIIDSVFDEKMYSHDLANAMKNELYVLAINNYENFFKLLKRFNYPNINDADVSGFFEGMIEMINDNYHENFCMECLRQVLKSARKKKELIFLKQNKENTIIENYYTFYTRTIELFKNAKHTFDEESEVEKEINKFEFFDGNKIMENYRFVKSKDDDLVQVSDCFVGLMGKFFSFINQISEDEINSLDTILEDFQKDSLGLFCKLILKSEKMCIYYLHSIASIYERQRAASVLNLAIKYIKD